jgi:hypothetical protein
MAFNSSDHSRIGAVLPRFRLRVNADAEEILERIDHTAKASQEVSPIRAHQYLILKIPSREREFWSPELQIQTFQDTHDKRKTLVRCVVGPSQSVWMFFTFIYSTIILLTLFGGMFGLVQYKLSNNSIFLWAWPIGTLAFLSIFAVSKYGQKKARNQTLRLVLFLIETLEQTWEVERVK